MLETAILVSTAALIAYCADVATKFSKTSHGPNPWTLQAFQNALRIAPEVKKVVALLHGSINDAYRCPTVNLMVGGVSNSYHQLGLAVDVKPGPGFTPESGARLVHKQAVAGALGQARTVIFEPGWVHVDWHNPRDVGPPAPCRLFRKLPDGKYEPFA